MNAPPIHEVYARMLAVWELYVDLLLMALYWFVFQT